MHFHFPFNALDVLWTLTFAAHLVLLVVLMGRDRVRQFPWFTASITLVALRLLTSKLLFGRLPQMTMATIFIVMAGVGAFLSLMVVLELARRAFGRVKRTTWLLGALGVLAVGAAVLTFWGPWPAWKTISTSPPLQLGQLLAQKGMLLADVENIAVGLLIILLGRSTGAGFRSKTQQIAIGLMTASFCQLGMQLIWERIAKTVVAHSREEYQHVIGLRDRLFNTNNAVYIMVLLWWIVCLWIDEKNRDQGTGNSHPSEHRSLAGDPDGEQEMPVEPVETVEAGGAELSRGAEEEAGATGQG